MNAVPEPRTLEPGHCPVCGTPVGDLLERCPECGLDLAGVPPRAGAYSRVAVLWSIVGFVLVYAVIVIAVALVD